MKLPAPLALAALALAAGLATANGTVEATPAASSSGLARPIVLLRDARHLRRAAAHDRRLTKACREGAFLQAAAGRYLAALGDQLFEAAVGGRQGLVDPLQLGETGRTYLFIGQGTSTCRVFAVVG